MGHAQSTDPVIEHLLVAIVLDGREVATLEVLRDRHFWLPLERFCELTGIDWSRRTDGRHHLTTPLGEADASAAETLEVDGLHYLSETFIRQRLAIGFDFRPSAYAIRLDLPWSTRRRQRADRETPVAPDFEPQSASLSVLSVETRWEDSNRRDERLTTDALLGGGLYGGRWLVRGRHSDRTDFDFYDYAWLRRDGDRLWLVGHQYLHLDPLLPGLELTGVQAAWTDHPNAIFQRRLQPGELLPRALRPLERFAGHGPPGGRAQLRVDGRTIAVQPILLNGEYDFDGVSLGTSGYGRIEVYLFEHGSNGIPTGIDDHSQALSANLLPAGVRLVQGGLGVSGNPLSDRVSRSESDGAAGFAQARWGWTRDLTLETTVQSDSEREFASAGLVWRFGARWLASTAVAVGESGFGTRATLDARWPAWRLRAFSIFREAGFLDPDAEQTHDHYAELSRRFDRRLELALIGRARRSDDRRVTFLRPAAQWRPNARLALSIRPDEDGDYVADLNYTLSADTRLSVHHQDAVWAELDQRISPYWRLRVFGRDGGDAPARYGALARWQANDPRRPFAEFGPLYSEGSTGWQGALGMEPTPGLTLRLDWQDDPAPYGTDGTGEQRIFLTMRLDYALVGGRLQPARATRIDERFGILAGRIEAPATYRGRLGDIAVLVDGRVVARTSADGSYFADRIAEGVREVDLDAEHLPIELELQHRGRLARVAPAATTRVDFDTRVFYGVAGRVRDADGQSVPEVVVKLTTADGHELRRAVTDRFGLYRLDRVAPGNYQLRINGHVRQSLHVDGHRFGQDLVVPPSGP